MSSAPTPPPASAPTPATAPSAAPVTAADKLLRTLLAFEGRAEATLGDLADALELPKSTLHRLLAKLKAYGLVEQDDASARYRLGLRAWTLALHARPYEAIRRAGRERLERLARESGETAFLTVAEGLYSVCVARAEGTRALRVSLDIGSASPIHLGASNLILLAFADPPARDAALEHWTPEPQRRAALAADLQRIRQRGWAFTVAQLTPGAAALAVPVLDPEGGILVGLSVGGPAERFTETRARELVPLLRRAAQRLAIRIDRPSAPPRSAAPAS